jgi:hypothetical protein
MPLSDFAGRDAELIAKPVGLAAAIGPRTSAGLASPNANNRVNYFERKFDTGIGLNLSDTTITSMSVSGDELRLNTNGGYYYYICREGCPEMSIFDTGLVGATFKTYSTTLTPGNNTLGVSGTLAGREVIMVGLIGNGGWNSIGLEYTNFGFWENRATVTGKVNNTPVEFTVNGYTPFVLVSTAATPKAPIYYASFTGKVVANAYDRTNLSNAKVASLVGTATLENSLSAMIFRFPNFYTMTTSLNISSNGQITAAGGGFGDFYLSNPEKNTTGIILPASGMTSKVTGQFYGASSAPNATEAVGTFGYNNAADTIGVNGSWGVKQQ